MLERESDLLNGLKNDDENTFKIIFKRYYSRLYYFIFEFIPYDDLVENVIQDTFLTLWNKRYDLDDNTNFSAYLFTVARNNCLYRLRSEKYRRKLFVQGSADSMELELNASILSTVDTSVYAFREIERIIEKTLDQLPAQCKNVFLLRINAKKNKEIADELNISVKVVEKHVTKGLKVFRKALKDYLPLIGYLFTI